MPRVAKPNTNLVIGQGILTAEAIASELRERLTERLVNARTRLVSITEMLEIARAVLTEFEPALATTSSDTQLAGWIIGVDEVAKRLPAGALEEFARRGLRLPPGAQLPPIGTVPPAGGFIIFPELEPGVPRIRFPLLERAVDDLAERQILTRPQFDRVEREMKQRAFTVARIDSTEVIGQLRDMLQEDIRAGTSLESFTRRVEEELGTSPIGPAHLENVYRTNTQSALAGGQATIANNPVVREVFPYARYSPIDDGRVREEHLALATLGLNGTNIYRADDPMWQWFTPPWDYNCRCGKTFMTLRQAAAAGVQEARRWLRTGVPPEVPEHRLEQIPFRPDPAFVGGGRFVIAA